jgi:hypothetical protein
MSDPLRAFGGESVTWFFAGEKPVYIILADLTGLLVESEIEYLADISAFNGHQMFLDIAFFLFED